MLNIKEPKLKEYHDQIIDCFIENNIPFTADYDYQTKHNSTVIYSIEVRGIKRAGFICVNKGKFGGVVFKNEYARYLEKEGFDANSDLPVFAESNCVASFIMMLAMPRINDLVIQESLMEEFDREIKKRKGK